MAYQRVTLTEFIDNGPRGVDERFLTLINKLPPLSPKGPWLAGGSVRKYMNGMQNHADYDIFFADKAQCDNYCVLLLNQGALEQSKNIFNRSFDFDGFEIQCIHHEFCSTLIKTLDRFDMTICQFGYDGTSLVWSEEAAEDARDMKFRFLNTTDPIYNLNRAFKYASEGYRPRDGEVKKILSRVGRDPKTLKNNRQISTDPTKGTVTMHVDTFSVQNLSKAMNLSPIATPPITTTTVKPSTNFRGMLTP